MRIYIINGPNINLIGIREKDIYGEKTYESLMMFLMELCFEHNIDAKFFQSNSEGELIDAIQAAYKDADGIIINPAAYTHTSIAILDALKAVALPAIEVHLSNIYEREDFRRTSYPALACIKSFYGEGFDSYKKAILYLKEYLQKNGTPG